MPTQLQAPKGVAEYVPNASAAFLAVRDALSAPASLAGYGYVELPVFEDTNLYIRGVGESTDVVSKEMYTFQDRGGRSITLRPEGTAGVVRAVVEHNLDRATLPVKLWYSGPFFRAERPQQGRYRQFHQVGVEALGSDDPALDAEVIAIAWEGFRSLGLTGVRLTINSLGDGQTRAEYRDVLTRFLDTLDLDEQTVQRVKINPLRVLDDKRQDMIKKLADAPLITDVLSGEALTHHEGVRDYLSELGIEFVDDPRLVRGLDYYTRTTFEFVHDGLGAQSAVGGGGRYDSLMADLGGQDLSGVGWGIGIDRTMLACAAEGIEIAPEARVDVYLVPVGDAVRKQLVVLAASLRRAGVRVDMAFDGRGLKGAMRAADRSGARFAVVMGDRDLAARTVEVKDLADGQQTTVTWSELIRTLQERLR
ncbi:MAG: histidine--tRNA ligase [Actinomycetes bacterium]